MDHSVLRKRLFTIKKNSKGKNIYNFLILSEYMMRSNRKNFMCVFFSVRMDCCCSFSAKIRKPAKSDPEQQDWLAGFRSCTEQNMSRPYDQ